jgi:hypothetical protein
MLSTALVLVPAIPGPGDSPEAHRFHDPNVPGPGKMAVLTRGAFGIPDHMIYVPVAAIIAYDDDGYCTGWSYRRSAPATLTHD